jgi:hypothetical protein
MGVLVINMIKNYTPLVNIENRDKRIWSKYNESLVQRAVNYGKRWLIEIFFSGLKRSVGEIVRAKKDEYTIQ